MRWLIALLFVWASLAIGPQPAGAQGITKSIDRYQACLDRAYTGALKALEEADRWFAETSDPGALHCKAVALAERSDFQGAAATLIRASNLLGDEVRQAELLAQAGNAYALAKDHDKALAIFDEALKLAPNVPYLTPEVLTDRSRIWAVVGNCRLAIADAGTVLELLPQHADAALIRAGCLRLQDDYAGARVDVERVLAIDPLNPDALLERGLISKAIEDYASAKVDWQSVVNSAPESTAAVQARRELGKLDAREQLSKD